MTSQQLAAWIKSRPGVFADSVVPVSLKLHVGKRVKEYPVAVRFKREYDAPEGARNPGPYTCEMVYVLGKRPMLPRTKNALQIDGEKHEWYFSAYYEGQPNEMQPHGASFMIAPWNLDEAIDAYASKPYDRYKLEIIPCPGRGQDGIA